MNDLTKTVVKSVSTSFGNDMYNFLKTSFKNLNFKFEGNFSIILQNYLTFGINKIGNVKTLFYDSKAQPLLDFYEPLLVTDGNMNDASPIDTASVSHFMRNKNNVLLTGNGGCGKTMLLKYLFLNSISEEFRIPIYIEMIFYLMTEFTHIV